MDKILKSDQRTEQMLTQTTKVTEGCLSSILIRILGHTHSKHENLRGENYDNFMKLLWPSSENCLSVNRIKFGIRQSDKTFSIKAVCTVKYIQTML